MINLLPTKIALLGIIPKNLIQKPIPQEQLDWNISADFLKDTEYK